MKVCGCVCGRGDDGGGCVCKGDMSEGVHVWG